MWTHEEEHVGTRTNDQTRHAATQNCKEDENREAAEDTNDVARWNHDEDHNEGRDDDRGAHFWLAASPKPFPGIYAAAAAATCPM